MRRFAVGLCVAAVVAIVSAALFVQGAARTASAQVSATLAIDADTSDGCTTVQSTANINVGTATSVGICLLNASSAPVSGLISSASLVVNYTGPLTASDVASDLTTDLNANPDWNQTLGGGSWDCNSLDSAPSAPSATPSPATITCESVALADVSVSGDVLLATLNFDTAASLGTSTLTLAGTDLSTGVDGINNPVCGAGITCTGASITVQAVPTATPTNTFTPTNTATNTATATFTATPCTVGEVPCTATPTATATTAATNVSRTNTPTATRTSVATATGTAGAARTATRPAGSVPTQPGGGAGGTIRLPNTGAQPADGSANHGGFWLTMSALVAFGLGGAMALGARRRMRR